MIFHKIILIDDDLVTNFINKKIIKSEFPDHSVIVFKNGASALDYIRESSDKTYLIFLDLNMPLVSGWEFLEAISKDSNTYRLYIHILSSSLNPEDERRALQYEQVLTYFSKPLTKEVLKDIKIQI